MDVMGAKITINLKELH